MQWASGRRVKRWAKLQLWAELQLLQLQFAALGDSGTARVISFVQLVPTTTVIVEIFVLAQAQDSITHNQTFWIGNTI